LAASTRPVRVNVYWELALHAWNEEADASAALAHMRRAIGLLEASEDTYQLARAHLLCAQLLSLDGRTEAAARHLARAEPLLVREGERAELGVLRAEQAKASAHRGEADGALALATEAVRLLGDDARHVGLREHALGAAHAAGGDLDEATVHFDEGAIEDLTKRHQWREATSVAGEWGKLLRAAGRQEEALETFERAMQLSDRSREADPRRSRA
jgi:tetratricopeptide (TPR) repeat protein